MRRRVTEAGGYYSRQSGRWVLPGAQHNCAPFAVDTQWCDSLEQAYDACDEHAKRVAEVVRFGKREAAYLRANS